MSNELSFLAILIAIFGAAAGFASVLWTWHKLNEMQRELDQLRKRIQ